MKVQHYHSLSVTKSGNDTGENEDAWRGVIPIDRDRPARAPSVYQDRPALFAVADGATEAAFSKDWARLLVNRFVDEAPLDIDNLTEASFARWLEPCREERDRSVGRERDIPWHGRAKVRAGAMATFLGVQFWQVPKTRELMWKAVAVGDCCLFVVREGDLRIAFPTDDPSDFGDMPSLVCSNPARAVRQDQITRSDGDCQKGDIYILATDAIACWALKQHRKGANPWLDLEDVCYGPNEKRAAWVARHRTDRSMRNDDATVLTVRIV